MKRRSSLLAVLGLFGCADEPVTMLDGGSSSGEPTASSSSSSTLSTSDGSSTGGTSGTSGSTSDAADDTTGAAFAVPPDVGEDYSCDFWDQDCPLGHKCMPWAEEGDPTWFSTRCRPVAEDPVGIGEQCHMEGWSTSGIDDCGPRALCVIEDLATLSGECYSFCFGSWHHPVCEDPDRACDSYGHIPVCVPTCDPLRQDCGDGQACISLGGGWVCVPDDSGELGVHGDPCDSFDECDPGLMCLEPSFLPPGLPCEGAAGCCVEICDLDDPAGDMQCTGAADGVICQAWYYEGQAPPGYEDVGACVLPQ